MRLSRFPTATGTVTRLACAHAEAQGVALGPLLRRANLTMAQIEDPNVRIKARDQIKFLNLVADELNDDVLGFHLAQLQDFRQVGLMYYVLASSDNVGDGLHRVARYTSLINDGVSQRCILGSDVGLSLHYVGVSRHLDKHQVEFWMTILVRIVRHLTSLRISPIRISMVHRRERVSTEFKALFGEEIEFGAAEDQVVFSGKIRELPIVSADPYLSNILIGYCERALASRNEIRASFRSSVENVVAPLLPHGTVRAKEIARRVGTSERTFARRLASEGLNYSELLERLREDLAHYYLADEQLPISQIAWLLGYTEVSAFSHAFNRWAGCSPREARAAGQEPKRAPKAELG